MIGATHSLGTAAAVLTSGGLFALAQPDRGFWPASFVCLVPLFSALAGRSLRARVWICVAMANVTALLGTAGAASEGLEAYSELLPVFAILGWLVLAQVLGRLPMLVFALLAGDPGRGNLQVVALRTAAAWVTAELLRSVFLSGMPWFLLAYGVAGVSLLARSASFGGVLLVSALLVTVNAALAGLVRVERRARSMALLACLGGVALVAGAGHLVPGTGSVPDVRVTLVRGPAGLGSAGPALAADDVARLALASAQAGPGPQT